MMRPKDLRQGSGTKTFLDAMHGGKVHLARFILDAMDGRIINSKTENSRTPLMYAVCLQDPGTRAKFTRLLLDKGADANCQDEDGRTALSHACEVGHLDVVKVLVQFNSDPEVFDAWGNSALMYAAFSGHSQVLEFLVRAFKRLGLRLDRPNNAGHSAIEVARFFGHKQCLQILNFPCRRGVSTDDPHADSATISEGECQLPKRLPRHVLERFSKQLNNNEDELPEVFQRQLKIGDSNGLWNRFRCPRSQSQDDNYRQSWALPPQIEKSKTEGDHKVLFTTKQLQNCQLRELRAKTLNSLPEPSQKDTGLQEPTPVSFPLWGKAKSFNLDLLSSRKQSYQGDVHDISLSASKLKRASLQDERCLIDKIECQGNTRGLTNDADKTVSVPKPLSNGKSQPGRALEENVKSLREEANDLAPSGRREQQKRGSLGQTDRHNKLLFARGEIPIRTPGFMGLGTRLLRRFTAPEFMRMVIDCSSGSSNGRGKISRSETFPFSHTHQQVNSQPSADSISGVKCEFESCSSQSALD
ncbi:Ankyrin repeat domain containing protein 63 [Dissostichus eleginoides]|uniref:Ankyrin repeat domain containing protein 63 n=1 Tax=Dissostichus eleginoides TaxID=100907 RepID=A0AAD9C1U5_DISEL|nr:Ankyrin repeat domain containing protein 63 [Dissostichus eleginoides]